MPAIGSSSSSRRGLAGQRHGDLELALLAVAELPAAHQLARSSSPTARRPCRAGSRRLLVAAGVGQEAEGMAGMRLHGQRHVVEGGELAQHGGDLEGTRQAQPHARSASAGA